MVEGLSFSGAAVRSWVGQYVPGKFVQSFHLVGLLGFT